MSHDYIYAGTSAYAHLQKLLTETERELLLGSADYDSFLDALQSTFFGTLLDPHDPKNISVALDTALIDAKHTIERIAPTPLLFSFVWLQYDFYNLKILLKKSAQQATDEGERDSFIPLGSYSLEKLTKAVQTDAFSSLNLYLARAVREAKKNTHTSLDTGMDKHYLEAALALAGQVRDPFVSEYVRIQIDLFNLRANLRNKAAPQDGAPEGPVVFVRGGSIPPANLEKTEDILVRLSHFGGDALWKDAVTTFRNTGDFTLIDKAADDYRMRWLKQKSIDLHSPAPLFAYFANVIENVQFVRAVATAKYVGLSEKILRDLVRTSFSSYVY